MEIHKAVRTGDCVDIQSCQCRHTKLSGQEIVQTHKAVRAEDCAGAQSC